MKKTWAATLFCLTTSLFADIPATTPTAPILPETPPSDKAEIISNAKPSSALDIDKISHIHPELTTFVVLINTAQMKDLFNGTGPFTVFAPSNDAFKKLGKEKIDTLMKPENHDQLSDFVLYHFVPGKYPLKNLKSNPFHTLNGKNIQIEVSGDKIKVNGGSVIKGDLEGPNGVIHVIDTVLVP